MRLLILAALFLAFSCTKKIPTPRPVVECFGRKILEAENLELKGALLQPCDYVLVFESSQCAHEDEARALACATVIQFMQFVNDDSRNSEFFKPFPMTEDALKVRIVFRKGLRDETLMAGVSVERGIVKYFTYSKDRECIIQTHSEELPKAFTKAFLQGKSS
jgi:hypothetical protein